MSYDPRGPAAGLEPSHFLVTYLSRQAAAGDADAARELAIVVEYFRRCDRGEIVLPEHPCEPELRAWNAAAAGRDAAPPAYDGPPVTATGLLARLAAAGVTATVEGGGLVIEGDLPSDLEPAVGVLWPLIIAAIAGVPVYAQDRAGRPVSVSPDSPLPRATYLLCPAGGTAWHRVDPLAFPPALERGS